jgi:hypothetical protein
MSDTTNTQAEGANAYVDLVVMEIPDTDLWALMAILNLHWPRLWVPGINIDLVATHTGWGRDKVNKVIKRAIDHGLIKVISHGRGIRVVRCVEHRYTGDCI